ncbi:MAG: glycosyltransferase family 4 protein [Desulfobulbaceae bacterium]
MKILVVAPQPFFQERGTPIAVRLLAETLRDVGHEVHLLVFAEGEAVELPGIPLHRHVRLPGTSGVRPGFSLKKLYCDALLLPKLVSLVREHRYDLVHGVEEGAFMALAVKYFFHIPYVYDMDSCLSEQLLDSVPLLRPAGRVLQWLEKRAVGGSSGVLAVCRSLEETARRYGPDIPVARLEDFSLLSGAEEGGEKEDLEDLRAELGIRGVLLLYVGNLAPYQGIGLLLEAFTRAVSLREDLSLVVIGGSPEDIRTWTSRAEALGVGEKIFFCGPRPVTMLGHYLRQADILVSPRIQGTNTPMKIYSYLDSGIPVIATDLPTHTQVLDDEIACLVAPEPGAMAAAMAGLAGDPERRLRLGRAAVRRVAEEYSAAAYRRKLKTFYARLPVRADNK